MGKVVDSSDELAVQKWSDKVENEIASRGVLFDPETGLLGDGGCVTEHTDLKAGGKSLTLPYVYQTRSRGKVGVETLIGNENGLDWDTFTVNLTSLRNGWSIDDQETDQYVTSVKTMDQMAANAVDWAADRFNLSALAHATGLSYITDAAYTLGNTINAIDTAYIMRPNGTAAGSLGTGDALDLPIIYQAEQTIKTLEPKIKPAKTPWGDAYIMLIHPDQHRSLRETNSAWYAAMIASLQGGNQKSGVWSNALGRIGDIILLEDSYVPPGLDVAGTGIQSSTRRSPVLGQGALAMAFGRHPGGGAYSATKWQFIKEAFDYQQKRGFAARTFVGMCRPRFTNPTNSVVHEQGVLLVETYAPLAVSQTIAYRPWREAAPTVTIT